MPYVSRPPLDPAREIRYRLGVVGSVLGGVYRDMKRQAVVAEYGNLFTEELYGAASGG
jgi:hypothetical protein